MNSTIARGIRKPNRLPRTEVNAVTASSVSAVRTNGYKPIIDGSFFHCEQHDIADENEPTVLKVDHVQNCVCNYDPDEEHQPEIEQEFLFDLFSHFHFLQSGSGGQFSV